eukprot:CAMPEP_0194781006 /NCGR_PEP_ID=MMETSP0323_2-20130528/75076_1 /TAXON_ID=2866 ORGANISM="Crypthecodinium cohnii, Strain Seligo" /NCGR_SAMPLE_ID=MMETSP0323_2 /ASSEMBLY_ACC=CAM_ASM_000346 /LENGTH=35 /DNA_ID= /DNA_START= /DNA_END= /DNA_ORIENTATION=
MSEASDCSSIFTPQRVWSPEGIAAASDDSSRDLAT